MRNKSLKRKIINTLWLVTLIAIVLGIYYNIYNSKAERVLQVETTAVDNYGYLEDQEFNLEAKHIGNNIYEIELPQEINGKKVIEISSVTLEDIEEPTDPETADTNKETSVATAAIVKTATTATNTEEPTDPDPEEPTDPDPEEPTDPDPEEPTDPDPEEPTDPDPEEPTDPDPEEPTDPDPEEPTDPDPEEPTDPDPEEPTDPDPEEPTDPDPEEPTDPNPEEPTDPDPEEPTDPNIIEIVDNKITLSKMDLINKRIKLQVIYDVAIIRKTEDGVYKRVLLSEKTEEERKELEEEEDTKIVYQNTLKYEAKNETETSEESVQLSGYLPSDVQLKVEEVPQEKLAEIFGEGKIDVAYDIKIVTEIRKLVPVDETDPESEMQEVIETIEISPEDFGEACEVLIKNANIFANSQVYHVKDDNTYEKLIVKENTEGSISFDAQSFSIYATSTDEGVMAAATTGIVTNGLIRHYEASNNTGDGHSNNTTTWKDLSGHYDGRINGATINDDYVTFDGINDWANLGQITDCNAITLEAKVKIKSIQNDQQMILANHNKGGVAIGLTREGKLFFTVFADDDRIWEWLSILFYLF